MVFMASYSSKRKRQCSESDTHLVDDVEDARLEARPKKREKAQTPTKEETVPLPPVSRLSSSCYPFETPADLLH